MSKLHPYLTFNGNCREAMLFYQICLGGELLLQPIGESSMADKMPQKMKQHILHATLIKDTFTLMASDMVADEGLTKGNAISLMLDCNSEEDLVKCYSYLTKDGTALHPIETTFWGALFGDLRDKYGNHWLLHYQKSNTNKMKKEKLPAITIETVVAAPIEKVWESWTEPEHIKQWCQASDDWHAPKATNDLKVGGSFSTTMAAKDGSMSFDFEGIYSVVNHLKQIDYAMSDGRCVSIHFSQTKNGVKVVETFDPEPENPIEMQRGGWQAILDNFRKHTEGLTQ